MGSLTEDLDANNGSQVDEAYVELIYRGTYPPEISFERNHSGF